jgi:hypothetical protein
MSVIQPQQKEPRFDGTLKFDMKEQPSTMTAVPQHFCLISEVAWDNTQDIHCSVIYIAQVLVLMDNVDDCPLEHGFMMNILLTTFMTRYWLMMHAKDSR